MAINVSVRYNGGLLPDIVLLTQCYFYRGTCLNAMKRFCKHASTRGTRPFSRSFRRFIMSTPASDEISRLERLEGQVLGIAESVPHMQEELERASGQEQWS